MAAGWSGAHGRRYSSGTAATQAMKTAQRRCFLAGPQGLCPCTPLFQPSIRVFRQGATSEAGKHTALRAAALTPSCAGALVTAAPDQLQTSHQQYAPTNYTGHGHAHGPASRRGARAGPGCSTDLGLRQRSCLGGLLGGCSPLGLQRSSWGSPPCKVLAVQLVQGGVLGQEQPLRTLPQGAPRLEAQRLQHLPQPVGPWGRRSTSPGAQPCHQAGSVPSAACCLLWRGPNDSEMCLGAAKAGKRGAASCGSGSGRRGGLAEPWPTVTASRVWRTCFAAMLVTCSADGRRAARA